MAISYHVTLVRMTIIKKARNSKHWQGGGEKGPDAQMSAHSPALKGFPV